MLGMMTNIEDLKQRVTTARLRYEEHARLTRGAVLEHGNDPRAMAPYYRDAVLLSESLLRAQGNLITALMAAEPGNSEERFSVGDRVQVDGRPSVWTVTQVTPGYVMIERANTWGSDRIHQRMRPGQLRRFVPKHRREN